VAICSLGSRVVSGRLGAAEVTSRKGAWLDDVTEVT